MILIKRVFISKLLRCKSDHSKHIVLFVHLLFNVRQFTSWSETTEHMCWLETLSMIFPMVHARFHTVFFCIQNHFVLKRSYATIKTFANCMFINFMRNLHFWSHRLFWSVGVTKKHFFDFINRAKSFFFVEKMTLESVILFCRFLLAWRIVNTIFHLTIIHTTESEVFNQVHRTKSCSWNQSNGPETFTIQRHLRARSHIALWFVNLVVNWWVSKTLLICTFWRGWIIRLDFRHYFFMANQFLFKILWN